MATGLLHLHNILRWVVLLLLIVVFLKSLAGRGGQKAFTSGDRKSAMFLMIFADIQLLIGLLLYFMGPWGIKNIQSQGMGSIMSNSVNRYWAVEHLIGMLLAIILIHIGYNVVKKNVSDTAKFKKLFWTTGLALLILLLMIPWPFRELIGRPWFPGM